MLYIYFILFYILQNNVLPNGDKFLPDTVF